MSAIKRNRLATFTRPFAEPSDASPASWDIATDDAPTWARAIDSLLSLRGYEDDWDGQGAVAPAKALVDTATAFATRVLARTSPPPDLAVPSVNGEIALEWHDEDSITEVVFSAQDAAEWRYYDRATRTSRVVDFIPQ